MQKNNDRVYKSIYFKDGISGNRKRRDVTVAFCRDGDLFSKCKELKSTDIKRIIDIDSYDELLKRAKNEKVKLSTCIKRLLENRLLS
ncbi:MAG: hypothetical protein RBU23_02280 [Candidatus Auribacterota bacterium]|jgi:hypothetical protein|nr:hypothetical protein [Candidatus Auribacterota bacterium]